MKQNLIIENWRKFLSEQEEPEGCIANTACQCVDSSVNIPLKKVQNLLADKYGKELMPKTFKTGVADGICGDETRTMIMKYQSENKLRCDACVGPETGKSMFPDMDINSGAAGMGGVGINTQQEIPQTGPINFTNNKSFPIINGRNFILPIEGANKSGHADWDQQRGKGGIQGLHAAIDVFVPSGTPLLAVADGKITRSNEAEYESYVQNMVNLLNKRIEQNELISDIDKALKATGKRELERQRLKSKFPKGEFEGAPPPAKWPDLSIWGQNNLTPKSLSNLLRYYRRTQGLIFPLGGIGITLETDPDQFGNTWRIYYGHCSKVLIPKGKVKAGDVIGLSGDTALFDMPGQNDHLHYSTVVLDDSGKKIENSPEIRFAGNRSIDPRRVIPAYISGVPGVYFEPRDS